MPFAQLPVCAQQCYKMYDVNGACVPPAHPSVDTACFCNDGRLAPWKTGTAGVCDGACPASPQDLGTIRNWFTSFCANAGNQVVTVTQTGSASTSTGGSSSGGSGGSSSNTGGGDWYVDIPRICLTRPASHHIVAW
jgi:hypothetical protein